MKRKIMPSRKSDIRDMYAEGKSMRAISQFFHHSFKTIQKIVNQDDFNNEGAKQKRAPRPGKLAPFQEVIDRWLLDDRNNPPKQKHTAQRIYDRLKDELGFDGSYSIVKRYVAGRREELRLPKTVKGCVERVKLPGVAEVDFGKFKYIDLNGQVRQAHALVMTFTYSNMGFVQIFHSEGQECLMAGLKLIFERMGGVPERIRIDNMTTAVIPESRKNGGEPVLTDAFLNFKMHYNFSVEVCNLASPQEKGCVENKVGVATHNFFTPPPVISSFAAFNEELFAKCDKYAQKDHYIHHVPIIELWEADKARLLKLPNKPYDVFRLVSLAVDKCGYARYETNKYGLCPELAGETVDAKVHYDHIDFIRHDKKVASYPRLIGRDQEVCSWEHYLPTLMFKPGALEHSRFYDTMPFLARNFLTSLKGRERKKGVALLMEMLEDGGLELCLQVLGEAAEKRKHDPDDVRQLYCVLAKKEPAPEPMELGTPGPELNYDPDLSAYDRLTTWEAAHA